MAIEVHEVLFDVLLGAGVVLFGQVVGGRLADQRLAAPGRAVQKETFRRGVVEFREEVGVQQRQFGRGNGPRFWAAS